MSNAVVVSRSHLIIGVCLPLAVLLGYLLAEPMESSSVAVMIMVLSVLAIPILMRWHHPLLILSWNAVITPFRIPGHPYLWVIIAMISLLIAVLDRAVNPKNRFLSAPALTQPLLALGIVVVGTALARGGVGFRALGSLHYGGKGYVYLIAAIGGYFALTSRSIPPRRAQVYMAMFLLSAFTAVVSNLAFYLGKDFYFLYELFPPILAAEQYIGSVSVDPSLVRIPGLMLSAIAFFWFLLARYGVQGVMDIRRPWRLVLLLGSVALAVYGGSRSAVLSIAVTFAALFVIEGLWRTRYMLIVLLMGVISMAILVPNARKMPLTVQRALSFLPVDVDPVTKEAAEASTQWRIEMWKYVLPDVPKYLPLGKGFVLSPQELELVNESAQRGYLSSWAVAALTGEYHNGPLSILIPLGLWGMLAFLWFIWAAIRVLYDNYRFGDPQLRGINAFILALFISRTLIFFFIFGFINDELFCFTGLVGMSVALNGGARQSATQKVSIPVGLALESA